MKDYYNILGVARTATAEEIKQAYRRAAMRHHPDRGGDEVQFKEIEEAYRVLGDAAQREAYDNPARPFQFQNFGSDAGGHHFDFNEIFSMFGQRFGPGPGMNATARIALWINLEDVAQGGPRIINLGTPRGQTNVEIEIPTGVEDGASVRYPGLAPGGVDLVVQYRVRPHAIWQRDGDNVTAERVIALWNLIVGTEIEMDTITGRRVTLKVPSGTQPGTLLRMRGHGLSNRLTGAQGDALIRIQTRIPADIPQPLMEMIQRQVDHTR